MGKTLVICEKPDQARKYANAMSAKGNLKKSNGYLENDNYIFTYAFGHLVSSKGPRDYEEFTSQPNKGWSWNAIPFFPPNGSLDYHITDKGKVEQMKIIGGLLKRADVDLVINGADAGREGELIFWEVYDYFKSKKPVKRLWCSTYVPQDVQKAFQNLLESDYYEPRRAAAYARQYADWALGMNLTVAFSIKSNMGRALHVGRVQTPTIALLVQRRLEIENFVPEDYFEIEAEFGQKYKGKWFKDQMGNTKISSAEEAKNIVARVQGKTGTVIKKKVEKKPENPKKLFNLTDLSRLADRKYGFDATKTLKIAQLLYEKYAILSYPRTSSRHLSEVQVPEIPLYLEAICIPEYESFARHILSSGIKTNKSFVNDKEVTDHHAIIPTKKKVNLASITDEPKEGVTRDDILKVYDLVVKRFLAVFYPAAIYEKTEIITEAEEETFKTSGKILVDPGWKVVYGAEADDDEEEETPKKGKQTEEKTKVVTLPPIEEGESNPVTKVEEEAKQTKPPSHHTTDTLLGLMDDPRKLLDDDELKEAMKEAKAGLGTEATRGGIIDNIIDRGYVEKKGKSLIATDLAVKLITVAPAELKSPIVTAEWEQKLSDMEKSKVARDSFEAEIRHYVEKNVQQLQQTELQVKFGNVHSGTSTGLKCPDCGKDVLEKGKVFSCESHEKENPCFVVFKEMNKKAITLSHVKQLVSKGETNEIKGFKKKDKTGTFPAKLKWSKEKHRVEFAFEQPKSTNLTCPLCGAGEIRENAKAFGCTNWKAGCKFTVWKKMLGIDMTMTLVKELVEKKETKKIEGFVGSKGKPFPAKLVVNIAEKKIDLVYL